MLKPKSILWVEDNPDTVMSITEIDQLSHGKVTFEELLMRTTLAPDYRSAVELLKQDPLKYDLIILDADFPKEMSALQRQSVLERLSQANGARGNIIRSPQNDLFAQLYLKYIEGKVNCPVLVHSISSDAPHLAFLLGLPFFKKGFKFDGKYVREKVEERNFRYSGLWSLVAEHRGIELGTSTSSEEWETSEDRIVNALDFTLERYATWEKTCGDVDALIERYLVA